MSYRRYSVSRKDKAPLLEFILDALRVCGCEILRASAPNEAPFRVTFDTPDGERMGIVVYAFFANRRVTMNRPEDERRFQVKYGPRTDGLHELWQDPFELYTTIFVGIDPNEGFFVGADPVLHSPTRFFISIEFKDQHVDLIRHDGWASWERQSRGVGELAEPVEILVGGLPHNFLRFVRLERAAKGLDAGHRGLLVDKLASLGRGTTSFPEDGSLPRPDPERLHGLAREFELTEREILDLIQSAPRLKMAVRGWVAEEHLVRLLGTFPEISTCQRLEAEGGPDVAVALEGRSAITIECKNVLRGRTSGGLYRLDFQRTRASKKDPCSRYYRPDEFQVVAACLHPQVERWDFRFALTRELERFQGGQCDGRLHHRVRLDDRWTDDAVSALRGAEHD